jgi:ABC-type branched-subunit amino acid transport system substrate-binding protein
MRTLKSLSAVAALALVLGACGGDDEPSDDDAAAGDATEDPGDDGEEDMTVATDFGVTEEPCPAGVNPDNGCIYLGTLTDLTGPFQGFGVPLTAAQDAFWERVNDMGGITAEGFDQAYDVDVATYNQSSGYDPTEHGRLYEEMKPNILALAQTLGTPTTQAILPDMQNSDLLGVPAGYTSLFNFEDVILEASANYCVETMNSVDYAVDTYDVASVMSVYYEGDYGGDAAGGAQIAAEARGLEFTPVPTVPGQDNQAEAIGQIVAQSPDLVIITTGPAEAATIVGGAAQNGFEGRFIGTGPTWNPGLLASDAAPALVGLFEVGGTFPEWDADTPGHQAMRDALGEPEDVNDGYTIGWIWQYALKAGLEAALANGDLTRAGLVSAANALETVDYEGMLPEGAGNYAGGPDAQIRLSQVNAVDPEATTGITTVQDFFTGPTAEAWAPSVCYEELG